MLSWLPPYCLIASDRTCKIIPGSPLPFRSEVFSPQADSTVITIMIFISDFAGSIAMMFRRINISYGLVAVLVLLTLIQIISGSWSVISYLDYDRNLQQIAFQRERIALLDEAYVIISDTRGDVWKMALLMAQGKQGEDAGAKLEAMIKRYDGANVDMDKYYALSGNGSPEDVRHAEQMRTFYSSARDSQINNIRLLTAGDFKGLDEIARQGNPTADFLNAVNQTEEAINRDVIVPSITKSDALVRVNAKIFDRFGGADDFLDSYRRA
ncbi:Tar ligand binding domain-containing protein [Salmonella enterica subsp. enterica serovar Newport]